MYRNRVRRNEIPLIDINSSNIEKDITNILKGEFGDVTVLKWESNRIFVLEHTPDYLPADANHPADNISVWYRVNPNSNIYKP